MDLREAKEIIACLPANRTLYHYCDDEYAAKLLGYKLSPDGCSIATLKQSAWGKLLVRKPLAEVLEQCGSGLLRAEDLLAMPRNNERVYVLTLGLWEGHDRTYHQTTRRGVNLVLQINFSGDVKRAGLACKRCGKTVNFNYMAHPVCRSGRHTMSWVRLDIDLKSGAALIEEIQTDWLRAIADLRRGAASQVKRMGADALRYWDGHLLGTASEVVTACDGVLARYSNDWSSMTLAAALDFLVRELGIYRIWFHDHETGVRLKQIVWSKPPRSLYTDLPHRFCFTRTNAAPDFVMSGVQKPVRQRLKSGIERFWRLDAGRGVH
jgi:RNA polymerase subunit RPABC4/transcription elongation factor Spt4